MVYLSPTQVVTVFASRINFDTLLNSILEDNYPCENYNNNDDGTTKRAAINQPAAQQQQDNSLLRENDIVGEILANNNAYRSMLDVERVKRHVDTRYRNRLNVYHPSLTNRVKTKFITKAKQKLESLDDDEYEPSTLCLELKRKRQAELELKRKHLYRDFLKCKKYKEDPSKLVVLYSKYEIPFDKLASIQINELTRWSVTECFENRFVRKTYEKTFFNMLPPFTGPKIIVDDQIKYLRNMYTITYNEDNVTRIEASPSMVKLASNMHSLFIGVYGNVIDDYPSIAKTCYECIKFANSRASSVNNISAKGEYNSLAILLRLGMVYNQQTFDDFLFRLADAGSMIFTIDEGFTGSENLLMDIIELDFYLVKPIDRLYRLVNSNGFFDYDEPMNALCVNNKCYNDILPAIYSEFCLLRLIAVINGKLRDTENELSSMITSKIKHVLENWSGIGNFLQSASTSRVSNNVSENLSMIRGNLLMMFPGLLTIMLQMCIYLKRTDLSTDVTQNLKILHTYKYRHNKREALNMSKKISMNIVNICRLLTFNLITTPNGGDSCLTETIRKLLSIPTFLLFNAGGNFLDSEVQV